MNVCLGKHTYVETMGMYVCLGKHTYLETRGMYVCQRSPSSKLLRPLVRRPLRCMARWQPVLCWHCCMWANLCARRRHPSPLLNVRDETDTPRKSDVCLTYGYWVAVLTSGPWGAAPPLSRYVCMYVCLGKHTYLENYWYVCMSGCVSGETYIPRKLEVCMYVWGKIHT